MARQRRYVRQMPKIYGNLQKPAPSYEWVGVLFRRVFYGGIFHTNGMVITHVLFRLIEVDPEEAKADLAHYLEWTKEKAAVQPSGANCGSVFQNVSVEAVEAQGLESASAAWYVDRCGWKGKQYGGLQVYPGHANFIVNDGSGTQTDFIRLVEDIRHSVYETYGVVLSPEAECIDNSGNTHTWQNLLDQNS